MARRDEEIKVFRLAEKIRHNQDVQTFKFEAEDRKIISFKPGEYITLYFSDDRFGWQGKSYSLSGLPDENLLSITVKKMGNFSCAIHNLSVGEKVKIEGPAGIFYPSQTMKNLVFLAAGIGITPFFSIIKDFARNGGFKDSDIFLFYSNKTKQDVVFFEELDEISRKYPNLKIIHTLTRERSRSPGIRELGRMGIPMFKKYIPISNENYYFMSGSIAFVNDQWRQLSEAGIPEKKLFTEAYY